MTDSRQSRRALERERLRSSARRRLDLVRLLYVISVLCMVAGCLGFLAAEFVANRNGQRQYHRFVDYSTAVAVTKSDVRVLEDPDERRQAAQSLGDRSGGESFVVNARVVYERAVTLRSIRRRYREPRFEELQRAGPEYQVTVELSINRLEGTTFVTEVWPHKQLGTVTSGVIRQRTEVLPEHVVNRVLPVLVEHISTAFAIPELTAGVQAGGVRGAQLGKFVPSAAYIIPAAVFVLGFLGVPLARQLGRKNSKRTSHLGSTTSLPGHRA